MKKSTVLALAIAGIVAAPVASADVYVSARLGVDMKTSDDSADESTTFGNNSSRLGWRGETDLGNGLTAFGKVEVGDLSNESTDHFAIRDLHVGLAGDFGKIIVGEKVYTAFYNHVTGPLDPTYWIGGEGFIQSGRTANALTYQGGSDIFSFEVTVEADGVDTTSTDGETGISGAQAGGSIALGDNWTIGVAFRDAEDSGSPTNGSVAGGSIYGNIGDIFLGTSVQADDDDTGITVHAGFGGFFVNFGTLDDDSANADITEIGAGYSASIGENTSWWIEGSAVDNDDTKADTESLTASLRFDF